MPIGYYWALTRYAYEHKDIQSFFLWIFGLTVHAFIEHVNFQIIKMSPTKFPISTGTGLSSENKLAQNNNNCFQCGKSLRTKKILKAHLLTHLKDGDRPKFKCSIDQCDKEYKSRPILKKHIKAIHLKTFKKVECNFCNLTFSVRILSLDL